VWVRRDVGVGDIELAHGNTSNCFGLSVAHSARVFQTMISDRANMHSACLAASTSSAMRQKPTSRNRSVSYLMISPGLPLFS
jgi:hypothetical protein